MFVVRMKYIAQQCEKKNKVRKRLEALMSSQRTHLLNGLRFRLNRSSPDGTNVQNSLPDISDVMSGNVVPFLVLFLLKELKCGHYCGG